MAHGRPAAACSTWPGRSTPRAPSTRWSSGSRAKRRPRRSAGRTGDSPRDARRAPRRRRLRDVAGQPRPVARRRGPARKKDDAEEARINCHIAPYRFERLRPLVPQGEEAAELRAIARDHERSSRDERRLLNPCGPTSSPPSPQWWPSPETTWAARRSCVCWSVGQQQMSDQRLAASGLTRTRSPSSVSRASYKPIHRSY